MTQHTWSILLIGLVTGLIFHAGSVALTWLLVFAIDPQTPVWPVLGAIAIARLSLAVPLTPNGLGVQEGTLAALLTAMQVSAQPALAAMLLARLSTVLLAAIGVALMVRGHRARAASLPLLGAGWQGGPPVGSDPAHPQAEAA